VDYQQICNHNGLDTNLNKGILAMSRGGVQYMLLKCLLSAVLLCCLPINAAADTLTLQQRSILADYSRSDKSVQFCLAMAKRGDRKAIKAMQLVSTMEAYRNSSKRKQLYSEFEYLNQRAKQSDTAVADDEFKRIFVRLKADANRYKDIASAGRKAKHWCKRAHITLLRIR